MPHITLTLYKGRSPEEEKRLACSLQECLMSQGPWKASDISVSVEGVTPDEFVKTVKSHTKTENLVLPSDYIR